MAFTAHMEKEKINRTIKDLSALIHFHSLPVEKIEYARGECPDGNGTGLVFAPYDPRGHWGMEEDAYYTFRMEVVIPPELDRTPVSLCITTGYEGQWNARNPQFIVYCNGHIKQALDTNHSEVLLSECAAAGDRFLLVMEAWTGYTPGDCVFQPVLRGIRRNVEALYYDLKVGLEAALLLPEEDGTRVDELNVLVSVCNEIDFRNEGSDAFLESVDRALIKSGKDFYDRFAGNDVTVHCIGHTHIDVAWLWRLCHTRKKAVRTFSTVCELMDAFPDFKFSSSQPQLYDFIRKDCPELYEKIKKRVKEGRFEPEGSTWLEMDANLPSGESLVRQLLFGKRFFRDEFGAENHILWLPDVFGYSAAMPQILKKAGVDCFITSKISWNEYNHLPNDTFLWRGIDGTEMLTHFHTMPNLGQDKQNWFSTYNGMPSPETVSRTWSAYQNKDLSKNVLASIGYGDGGGGPTREMLEYCRRMKNGLPGVPKVQLSTKDAFVRALQKDLKANARHMPSWEGELYMEMHRGTFTTQGRNKRYNRKSEFAYQGLELLSALEAKALGSAYPRSELRDGWECILLNQFHDIIPGSSIKEVYKDSAKQYEQILSTANGLIGASEARLSGKISAKEDGLAVFNRTGHTVGDVVFSEEIPEDAVSMTDGNGGYYPIQRCADGKAAFYAPQVPAMGYRVFYFSSSAPKKLTVMRASTAEISGRYNRIRFDRQGNLSSVYDKKAQREILPKGQKGNRLLTFEDRPRDHDAWDITVYYEDKEYPVDELTSARITDCGPVFSRIELLRPCNRSTIRQLITVYADMPRIDFYTEVHWQEDHTLLKCAFPVDIHASFADYDIQFGNISRPTHTNTSWETAKFECVGHKWADFSQSDYGVSLLNDCKYGHDIRNGVMRLSLLRSPTYPDPTADRGHHVFTYSLLPHANGWREACTPDAAATLNTPFDAVRIHAKESILPPSLSVVSVNCRNIRPDTVKLAEDSEDLIVRLYEYENACADTDLALFAKAKEAWSCDLLENIETSLPVIDGRVKLHFKPYEIKTVRIRF